MSENNQKIYLPGLNGIRFLAALSVIIWHIEPNKRRFDVRIPDLFVSDFSLRGSDAVTLFFVLSGFLITYLLLVEHQKTGTVNVKKFYMRRLLRIWPLYYLIVLLGFVALPLIVRLTGFDGYWKTIWPDAWPYLWPYLLFIPNAAPFFGASGLVAMGHLWTIGIEEQFYLIWPQLMKRLARHVLPLSVAVILIKILIIHFDSAIVVDTRYPQGFRFFISFLTNFRIESMAMGAIGAYLIFINWQRLLNIVYHPIVEKTVLFFMIGNFIWFDGRDVPLKNLVLSFLYILFILNVSTNPRSTVKLENRVFNYLGRISYGLYMYHNFVIYLVLLALSYTRFSEIHPLVYNVTLYTIVIGLTIAVSGLSYVTFERFFLSFKNRFTVVASTTRPADAPLPEPTIQPVPQSAGD